MDLDFKQRLSSDLKKPFSEVFYSFCSPELAVRINDSAKDNDAIKELPGNDGQWTHSYLVTMHICNVHVVRSDRSSLRYDMLSLTQQNTFYFISMPQMIQILGTHFRHFLSYCNTF